MTVVMIAVCFHTERIIREYESCAEGDRSTYIHNG